MTLLEVLIALAIFATAALALLNSMAAEMNAVAHFREMFFASGVAENSLIQTQIENPAKEKKAEPTKVSMTGQDWFIKRTSFSDTEQKIRMDSVEVRLTQDSSPVLSLHGGSRLTVGRK